LRALPCGEESIFIKNVIFEGIIDSMSEFRGFMGEFQGSMGEFWVL
jgi:hypothetical protein